MRYRGFIVATLALLAGLVLLNACTLPAEPEPVIHASPLRGYPPLEVSFDARLSGGTEADIVSYHWDFDDGEFAASASPVHLFESKGEHTVRLTITDTEGKPRVGTLVIHVLNRVPHASFRISPFGAPRDYPVQFDASESYDSDGEIVSYLWDFGDGETAEGMNVEHVFPRQQEDYLITLTVTDEDGASNSTIRTVIVLGCDTCG